MPDAPILPADSVELTAQGRSWRAWKSVSIDVGLENAAGSFDLTLSAREPRDGSGSNPDPFVARAGSDARISIGGETVITGWIDTVTIDLTSDGHDINIRGRSKIGDLIDCSAIHATSNFTNRTLLQIATALAQPFGIAVRVTGEAGAASSELSRPNTGAPFARFAIQPGETVFEAIERAAKMRGLLITSAPDGALELINPAPVGPAVALRVGHEIMALSARHDVSQRFSSYTVRGQQAGDDQTHGREAAAVRAQASDPGISRHRPLIVSAEDQVSPATARTRAQWEASVRAAKSQGADVTVVGWRMPTSDGSRGSLWKQAQLVTPTMAEAFIDGPMMVAGINFSASDGEGVISKLSLAVPGSYAPQPVAATAEAARVRGGRQA